MKAKRSVAIIALAAFSQTACYSSYFITKSELEKLESTAEQRETVTVFGDCPSGTAKYKTLEGKMWAQAAPVEEEDALPAEIGEAVPTEIEEATEEKSDAAPTAEAVPAATTTATVETVPAGCTKVDVSTANPLQILTKDGKKRVTPFNFIMNNQQLVSPEYNLLENLNDVEGAEVSQFSTWKTVGTIAVVTVVAVGTFIGVTLLAPEGESFQN